MFLKIKIRLNFIDDILFSQQWLEENLGVSMENGLDDDGVTNGEPSNLPNGNDTPIGGINMNNLEVRFIFLKRQNGGGNNSLKETNYFQIALFCRNSLLTYYYHMLVI